MQSLIKRFRDMKFAYKIGLLPLTFSIALMLLIAITWGVGNKNLGQLEEIQLRYQSTAMTDRISDLLETTQDSLEGAVSTSDPDMLDAADRTRSEFRQVVVDALENPVSDREMLENVREDYEAYFDIARSVSRRMMNDEMGADVFSRMEEANSRLESLTNRLQQRRTLDQGAVVEAFGTAETAISNANWVVMVIALVALACGALISVVVIRMLTGNVNQAAASMRALVKGEFGSRPEAISNDEIGVMLGQLLEVEDTLGSMTAEVDALVTAVREGRLNERGDEQLFSGAYRQLVRNINELIDAFVEPINVTSDYIDGIASGKIPAPLEQEYRGDFNLIKNNLNSLVHVMGGLSQQIESLSSEVQRGNLTVRAADAGFDGVWGDLIHGLNGLVEAFVRPFDTTKVYLDRISRGDIPKPIHEVYHGDFNQIKDNLNRLVHVMGGLVEQAGGVVEAAQRGELEARAKHGEFEGAWCELIVGINETLEAVERPICAVSEVMRSMSRGDVSQKIAGEFNGAFGDLRDDVNATIDELVSVIAGIKSASASVSNAAHEISSGNMSLSQRTEQQSANLDSTSTNMDSLLSTVRANTERAVEASKSVDSANTMAQNGSEVASEAMDAMRGILEASSRMAENIAVIDEIAHQTNLLALNAAVEAADAGEHGRGFAVVATEVRNLASRSKDAARQIGQLIKDSNQKVELGSSLVDASGARLREILEAVGNAAQISREIQQASEEQTENIAEVHGSVREMETVTQQNAALAEEAMAASESLTNMAKQLDEEISFFNTGDGTRHYGNQADSESPLSRRKFRAA